MQLKTDTQNEKNGGYTIALFSQPFVWGSTKGQGGKSVNIAIYFRLLKVMYNFSGECEGESILDPDTLKVHQKLRILHYCEKLAEGYAKKIGLKVVTKKRKLERDEISTKKGFMVINARVTWCLIKAAKR